MRILALLLVALLGCSSTDPRKYAPPSGRVSIRAEGASLPAVLVRAWATEYQRVDPTFDLAYSASGSGAGARALLEDRVDVGTSDSFLSEAELKGRALLHVPITLGAVAVAYRLVEVPQLHLSGDLLARIYLGEIKKWNDREIARLNPEAKLPDKAIVVVFRDAESGTTQVFTELLAKSNDGWRARTGVTKSLKLTIAQAVPAANADVNVALLQKTDGALGFLDLASAQAAKVQIASVYNAARRPVRPTLESISAAAAETTIPPDLRVSLVDAPGEGTYPLVSFSYALVRREIADARRGEAVAAFLWWATHDGQKYGPPRGYATLPADVVIRVEEVLRTLRAGGAAPITRMR